MITIQQLTLRTFSEEEVHFLEVVAGELAFFVSNRQRYEHTDERLGEIMRTIHENVVTTAEDYGRPGDYVFGANADWRRSPDNLRPEDALDFWRVEEFVPDRLLRLQAEMKVPGRAWLEFEVDKRGYVGVRVDRKRKQQVTVLFRALKKPLTKELEEKIHGTGFAVLMALFVLVTIADVTKFGR